MAKLHLSGAVCVAALLGLAACNKPAEQAKAPEAPAAAAPAATPAQAAATPTTYACDDGRSVKASYPDADTAVVELDGKTHTLKVAVSASGARYVGEGLQWWTKGMTDGQLSPLKAGEDIASAAGVNCKAPESAKPAG